MSNDEIRKYSLFCKLKTIIDMKPVVIIAASSLFFASLTGCKKAPAPVPTTVDLMTGSTWYLKNELLNNVSQKAACTLSEQLTFNKDSTGNHFYAILCDTSQSPTVPFKWYQEGYNPTGQQVLYPELYYKDINGVPVSNAILRVFTLNKDTLGIEGSIGGQPYRAVYTSTK